MTTPAIDHLKHEHVYLGRDHDRNARRTTWVVALTEQIEGPGDSRITDLHVWRLGPEAHAAIVSVATDVDIAALRERLKPVHELAHITIERNAA